MQESCVHMLLSVQFTGLTTHVLDELQVLGLQGSVQEHDIKEVHGKQKPVEDRGNQIEKCNHKYATHLRKSEESINKSTEQRNNYLLRACECSFLVSYKYRLCTDFRHRSSVIDK